MGRSYLFECPKCGYKASVSGGADEGLEFAVQTTACRDCRRLFDSVMRWRVPDNTLKIPTEFQRLRLRKSQPETPPTLEAALNRLPLTGVRKFKWALFKLRCPVSLAHRVNAWNEPGKCPRCGTFMEKNALPFRYWD
jgi:ribosomal protein S27AE